MRLPLTTSTVVFALVTGISVTVAAQQSRPRFQVLFNRFQAPVGTVFRADADGTRERSLLPAPGLEYSPSFSADGQWIIFTSERDGHRISTVPVPTVPRWSA